MKKLCAFIFFFFIIACTPFRQTQHLWIQNSQNENIYIKIDGLENVSSHKLAIIQHGLASNMSHPAVQTAKKAFLDNHYVVISFDSRYSLGEGDNNVEKVRLATFNEDLETVVNWAKNQSFYDEPFALAGHSLGGASVIQFSAKHPELVNVLVPITPVISGRLWEKSCMQNMTPFCKQWKQNGIYNYTDAQNHKTAIIPYAVIPSCNAYNAYTLAPKIPAKTLLIAAENDIIINLPDMQKLSQKLQSGHLAIIPSGDHNFSNEQNQADLYQSVSAILKN